MRNFIKNILFVILGSGIVFLFIMYTPANSAKTGAVAEVDTIQPIPEPILKYGIPVDSFMIDNGYVRRNQNLSEILAPYKVSARTIDQIARSRDVFDVRKIRPGKRYSLFCNPDTSARYFVYEQSQVDYIVIGFGDSLTITPGQKAVTSVKRIASGFIESNLWNAMKEYDIDPMMSIELSEIYAWSIDFFGLKKGDHFSVIYEEQYVDTVRVGIGKIYSALFNHRDKDFYAISFEQDSVETYFDSAGQSLRRAFLKAPLRFSRISSGFSHRRLHPVLKIYRPHTGVDYAAPTGTPVHAVGDGVVIDRKYTRQGGRIVKIKHNSVYTTGYLHLSRYGKGIKTGAHVKQGQVIGYVGSSGLATGPHLDFRFWRNGKPINPLKVESPPVEPIKKVNKEEYNRIRNNMIRELREADEVLHREKPVLAKLIQRKRSNDTEVMNLIARYEYKGKNIEIPENLAVLADNQEWTLQ
ncbi:MAG: peptidoglycan DD-metalloendopeptidase family protein [Salinivirgaceae bacterium]